MRDLADPLLWLLWRDGGRGVSWPTRGLRSGCANEAGKNRRVVFVNCFQNRGGYLHFTLAARRGRVGSALGRRGGRRAVSEASHGPLVRPDEDLSEAVIKFARSDKCSRATNHRKVAAWHFSFDHHLDYHRDALQIHPPLGSVLSIHASAKRMMCS